MAISRQSDSIWVEAAMGYGHSHSPARDEDHHGAGKAARDHGESLGKKHAQETIDHYHRDSRGRFAPMAHHESERDHAAGRVHRQHRDGFEEGYHKGFSSHISAHEREEKRKANKQSFVVESVKVDPYSHEVILDDPGRLHYQLSHGGSTEGYEAPGWMDSLTAESPKSEQWQARNPTPKHPHRYDTDTLKNIANDPNLGLGLDLSEKAPFSPEDVGAVGGRKSERQKRAPLRPGELASAPIQVTDHQGNAHTFVHQITAPNLNPHDPDDPKSGGPWVVSLHHHISRPNGSAEWLPSEVTHHVGGANAVRGRASDDLLRDIWGQLHANSDMVTMYGAGAQRVGDKDTSVEYEFKHPAGDVVYRAKLANGWNKYDGHYYDPLLSDRHADALPGGAQWNVAGHALERQYAHDPNSPTHMTLIEGSHNPNNGQAISFPKDDLSGVIQHVWNGLGAGSRGQSWRGYPQHRIPNTGGRPVDRMIRGQAAWVPENNIHRSAERLPITF